MTLCMPQKHYLATQHHAVAGMHLLLLNGGITLMNTNVITSVSSSSCTSGMAQFSEVRGVPIVLTGRGALKYDVILLCLLGVGGISGEEELLAV